MSRRDSNSSGGLSADDRSSSSNREQHSRRRNDNAIRKAMASLQLPHMHFGETPTLRILIVADVDLTGVSALAEAALLPDPNNPLQRVDLCLACGPFCEPDDLNMYYDGRQRQLRSRQSSYPPNLSASGRSASLGQRVTYPPTIASPYYKNQRSGQFQNPSPKRTREERAALEGLMTAALSQLESIVCRVLFLPGSTDPLCKQNKKRLTPNSRNLHHHWVPLSPGLGCAGLLHLDWDKYKELEEDVYDEDDDDDEPINHHSSLPLLENNDLSDSNTCSEEEDSTSHDGEGHPIQPVTPSPSHSFEMQNSKNHQYNLQFCQLLEKLVRSAPPISSVTERPSPSRAHASINGLQQTSLFQSILVTNFHHLSAADQHQHLRKGIEQDGGNNLRDGPWPPEHEEFCIRPIVQEHVLLEIAAGRNSQGDVVPPRHIPKGENMTIILPGSLRERGDYCLVDVAFVQDSSGAFHWKVQHTQFQNL